MTDIDAVAEAILATMQKHRPRRIRRAELDSIQYEECQEGCKYELGGTYEHLSKLSAQAAIDALGLTQEWGIRSGVNIARNSMSESNAKAKAAMWPESFEAVSRLAGPWVRVEEQP